MNYSVIIPSRSAANLVPCVRAIREAGETCRVIVVDDGVNWAGINPLAIPLDIYLQNLSALRITRVFGVRPFCFARNVNLGIAAAGDDDVIIMNDDALLDTPNGFGALSKAMPGYGLGAAITNNAGNLNQVRLPQVPGRRHDEPRMVCFIAVYSPRHIINSVGLLDEQFIGYGMDDDDYSLRVRNAGYKIGIFDGCYVDHASLKSEYRGGPVTGGDFRPNLRRFIEKWGVDNRGKTREQSEWAHLWPETK